MRVLQNLEKEIGDVLAIVELLHSKEVIDRVAVNNQLKQTYEKYSDLGL